MIFDKIKFVILINFINYINLSFMFKKQTSKKNASSLILDEEEAEQTTDKIADQSKNIVKCKPKGVSIHNLKNMREVKHSNNKPATSYEE